MEHQPRDCLLGGVPPSKQSMAALVEGLPIGLQIVGPMFAEQNILRASCCVEQACATGARPSVGAGGLPHKEKQ